MQKEHRLRKNEDFQVVFKRGQSVANRQLVLYFYNNRKHDTFRLGISISKKIGHAVIRNRLKRQIKEAVLKCSDQIHAGFDLVLIVRKGAVDLEFDQLQSSFLHVLRKTTAYKNQRKST